MTDADNMLTTGLRVLVVEDNYLMAESLTMLLADLGCTVVGPAGNIEQAMSLAEEASMDGALLDINLRGHMVFPVGMILRRRDIPFALVTGYSEKFQVTKELEDAPRLVKPYKTAELESVIGQWRNAPP